MLVLVMTLLGILFVVGVAFLATMNFEADVISAERQRAQVTGGVEAAAAQAGSTLRNSMMSSSGVPFGDTSVALTPTAYAEMPGVQNSFSPVEPILHPNGQVVYNGYFDAPAQGQNPYTGSTLPAGFYIDVTATNGAQAVQFTTTVVDPGTLQPTQVTIPLTRCSDGPLKGSLCTFDNDCKVNTNDPTYPCLGPRVTDADGDGIVDSILVDAEDLGLSPAQISDLGARVNPASNPSGKISIGLRVVPHGGMVNLNDAHPTQIQTVFDLPYWPDQADPLDPNLGNFVHGPTWAQRKSMYSPVIEEPLLRRRGFVPSRDFVPSLLHGNPLLDAQDNPTAGADMAWMLFWPRWRGSNVDGFQDVWSHRFSPFIRDLTGQLELFPGDPNYYYWPAMMEPLTATAASPLPPWNPQPGTTGSVYDRRHLVTTVNHDDLLVRSASVRTPVGSKDLRAAMIAANWTAWDPDACIDPALGGVLPFEYLEYPPSIDNAINCCPTESECVPDPRKGRMQLSLPWIEDELAAANNQALSIQEQEERRQRVYHTIHDAFFMLVRNAIGPNWEERTNCSTNADCASGEYCRPSGIATNPGKCTSSAPYWDDFECATDKDCKPGDFRCDPIINRCMDPWTNQRRNEALLARAAASLTANMIDYVDNDGASSNDPSDDLPTRIALRHLAFVPKCIRGTNHNQACDPTNQASCRGGTCPNAPQSAGRDLDLDPGPGVQKQYVYGLEVQPFISEVVTVIDTADPGDIIGRAVELYNPYPTSIFLNKPNDRYFLYEINGNARPKIIPLTGIVPASFAGQPLVNHYTVSPGKEAELFGTARPPNSFDAAGGGLSFENGSTIYLVRRLTYPGDSQETEIVVDQFSVEGQLIGKTKDELGGRDFGPDPSFRVTVQRSVKSGSPWTVTVPATVELEQPATESDLSSWNVGATIAGIHPVVVDFVNSTTNSFRSAFPTTGSMLLLLREANRSFTDRQPPIGFTVNQLAFTSWLDTELEYRVAVQSAFGEPVKIKSSEQIDNGRMPIFDVGTATQQTGPQHAHHVPAQYTDPWIPTDPNSTAQPGDLNALPWGQLVFDYFTALPLSNPGPYFPADPDLVGAPASLPRIDQGGLRVHGRVNLNAAPWKVLSGVPYIPMNRIPIAFQTTIANALQITDLNIAQPMGPLLAQAIVAYREARPIISDPPASTAGTGDYNTGNAAPNAMTNPPPPLYGRGWTHPLPAVRRGTGFMSVGELANVRHPGATMNVATGKSPFRLDSSILDDVPTDNNAEDFVAAAAPLIALGDWVSVRSHVFTVYGVIRGIEDPSVIAGITDPIQQNAAIVQDVDSRAIRFQETVDRLPVLLGEPRPTRIGGRTVGKYTDVSND